MWLLEGSLATTYVKGLTHDDNGGGRIVAHFSAAT